MKQTFDILAYGARGDGRKLNTAAIQRTADRAPEGGRREHI